MWGSPEQTMKKQRNIAIILAGGSGQRFGSALPKQFLPFAALKEYPDALRREEERFAADPENYGDAVCDAAFEAEEI